MVTSLKSATMNDAYMANPMPLVGGDFSDHPGSRRPDVVVPIDPTKPPGPGNIKRIFEVKFPPDTPRPGQIAAYEKIAGAAASGRGRPERPLRVQRATQAQAHARKSCRCAAPKKQKHKDPQRQEEPEPEPFPQPYAAPDPGTVGILAVLMAILKKAAEVVKGPAPAPVLSPLPPVTPGFPGSKPPSPVDPIWPWSPRGSSQ